MAIPDYQSIMLPLLKFVQDGREYSFRETVEALSAQFGLTPSERKELLPSGQQAIFDNRVGWARTYLKKAGLLKSARRGFFQITDRGIKSLKENPREINVKYLKRFDEFVKFQTTKRDTAVGTADQEETLDKTPEEMIETGYAKLRNNLAVELLNKVKECSPDFFERLVVELIVRMGYGGSRIDAGKAVGQTRDGGIDGIIKEDKLGLDVVYIQAKKWDETVVGRPEVQKFVGALQGQRAKKGIFITTSSFSSDAIDYVSKIDSKVVLINGDELGSLMIENDIGVSSVSRYDLKKIDIDYFTDT
jgi:restriction system protein